MQTQFADLEIPADIREERFQAFVQSKEPRSSKWDRLALVAALIASPMVVLGFSLWRH